MEPSTKKSHKARNVAIIVVILFIGIFGYLGLNKFGITESPSQTSGYPKTILDKTFTVSSLPNDNVPRSTSWTVPMNYREEGKVTITISGEGLLITSPSLNPETVGSNAGTAYGNPAYVATFTVTNGGPITFGVSVYCGYANYNGCLVSGHITVQALS